MCTGHALLQLTDFLGFGFQSRQCLISEACTYAPPLPMAHSYRIEQCLYTCSAPRSRPPSDRMIEHGGAQMDTAMQGGKSHPPVFPALLPEQTSKVHGLITWQQHCYLSCLFLCIFSSSKYSTPACSCDRPHATGSEAKLHQVGPATWLRCGLPATHPQPLPFASG